MSPPVSWKQSKSMTLLTGVSAITAVICILIFPSQAFQASLGGLHLWWTIVFPALLPFLVLSELLIAFGFVHALGTLLDPLLRLLFRIPGAGGWAVAMSLSSSLPAGAGITAKLRKSGAVSREEGERLLGLSHLAGPVILLNVIAVGFMGNASLGLYICFIYYITAALTGMLFRYSGGPGRDHQDRETAQPARVSVWNAVYTAMHKGRQEDGRSFGKALGDAVTNGIQTLMMIGGFMMIFSVLLAILKLSPAAEAAAQGLTLLLSPFGVPAVQIDALLQGLFELHVGAFAAGRPEAQSPSVMWSVAAVCSILAWSGLSLHAQVRTLIRGTDLRYGAFFRFRAVHGALCLAITPLLWRPLNVWFSGAVPSFLFLDRQPAHPEEQVSAAAGWLALPYAAYVLAFVMLFLLGAAACLSAARYLANRM
ncbi:nucleoside recognition domain-containing protein [Paenibacillus gansuensis]|uniref:Nucleoside recognition domain-containing protein n=1 Tax=Paenibacillus gansuensis TaxID=306542 RepID=A0ABW5PC84_9BACL